jgi:hypothetical protein
MSNHLPAAWCDRCGLLVPASDVVDGVCAECDAEIAREPPGPTDAEIDRALDRMDHLFGPGWLEDKK